MSDDGTVCVETNGNDAGIPPGVAVLRFDRPKLNLLNLRMQDELIDACARVDHDSDVRAVVLYGGTTAFAAGADIKEFSSRTQAEMLLVGDRVSTAAAAVMGIGKPVIAAAEGYVLGGGFEIAVAADFRVSSRSAQWGLPEVLLGLMPAAGGTQRLPRIVGAARAKRLMFLGSPISGEEALEIGLVDEVCAEGDARASALRLAARFAGMAPLALRAMKTAIDRSFDVPLDVGREMEQHLFNGLFATEDRRRGIESFLANGPGRAMFSGT